MAGAWIGLAIKTDGAAVAGGGITESLIMAKAAAEGIRYQPGWILATTTTVKIFIDIFIGIWAFILGYITRSTPFIILVVAIVPLTRLIVNLPSPVRRWCP